MSDKKLIAEEGSYDDIQPGWLRQPATDLSIHFSVVAPPGQVLTGKTREAVDDMLRHLQVDSTLSNFAKCNKGNCQPMTTQPCYAFVTCHIQVP